MWVQSPPLRVVATGLWARALFQAATVKHLDPYPRTKHETQTALPATVGKEKTQRKPTRTDGRYKTTRMNLGSEL